LTSFRICQDRWPPEEFTLPLQTEDISCLLVCPSYSLFCCQR